jgi:predicted Abi (CAAX) family protease
MPIIKLCVELECPLSNCVWRLNCFIMWGYLWLAVDYHEVTALLRYCCGATTFVRLCCVGSNGLVTVCCVGSNGFVTVC